MILITRLNAILSQHAHVRVNGTVASERTISCAGECLRSSFRRLYELEYKLEDPANLAERHIRALCEDWHSRGYSPKTIQGKLSQLRKFSLWIGKKGLVKNAQHYLPDVPRERLKVKTSASKSKSWAEAGINVQDQVELAMQLDWRFGLMLMAQVAFGLRRMEVLQMRPWKCDEGRTFYASKTKGGRPRLIYIDTEVQRAVMDLVKSKIGKNDVLGWTQREDGSEGSLAYAQRRYNYLMARLGITKEIAAVTGHGLRAQYAENAALMKALIPPTLGGTAGQMPRDDLDLKRLQVSESLGHSRVSVTGAYYGSFGRKIDIDGPGRAAENINACFESIKIEKDTTIAEARLADCMKLLSELVLIAVFGDVRKVHYLWEYHSQRHATDWLKPSDSGNLAALEAAAMSVMRTAPLAAA